jgi:hypothetical protein
MNFALPTPITTGCAVTLRLAPLDVPLHVECVHAAPGLVAAACHGWEGQTEGLDPLRLRVELSPALSGIGNTVIHADGDWLTVQGPGAAGRAEVSEGFAQCMVSAEYLSDPTALRQDVLEPLVLMLLTRRDRTPLHASAFIADGLAILLAGRTGAGKSCLARAADAAGFQVLSDDTVYVQLVPRLTVWGWPSAAHLLFRDAPDVTGPTRLRGGRVKHVVPLRSASEAAIACNEMALCVLSRARDAKPALHHLSAAQAEARLWPLDEGFDLLPGPIEKAVAALSAAGAWDLSLSADPAEAIRLLVSNLPRLRERGRPLA